MAGVQNLRVNDETPAQQALSVDEMVRMFGTLSHDLKSPIFAIDGFSELLISDYADKLDDEGKDFLRRIRSSAQQMKKVLEDMSRLVKLLSRPNARKPTPLKELVEEVLLKYNYAIEEGGVKVDVAPEMPVVNVDPEKVREALGAVVANALFFTDRPEGERTLTIECSADETSTRLCVRDNGIGMEPRYAHQAFELGGASKFDKSRGGGPGYGLYLARRVMESHGGAITVDCAVGEGCTFCLSLPA